jgi:mannose-6-phosphate isomerase-like protein (cupin superfamily)
MAEPDVTSTTINPNNSERFQSLRRELGIGGFGMNALTLRPRQRGRIHSHDRQEEVYLVLEGTLTLVADGEPRDLRRGELARVAPDVRRRLVNRHPDTLVLLAAGGATEHEGRDGRAWASWDEEGEGRPPQDVPMPENVPVDG